MHIYDIRSTVCYGLGLGGGRGGEGRLFGSDTRLHGIGAMNMHHEYKPIQPEELTKEVTLSVSSTYIPVCWTSGVLHGLLYEHSSLSHGVVLLSQAQEPCLCTGDKEHKDVTVSGAHS